MNIPSIKVVALSSIFSIGSLSINQCKAVISAPLNAFKSSSDSLELVMKQKLHDDALKTMETRRKVISDSLGKVFAIKD